MNLSTPLEQKDTDDQTNGLPNMIVVQDENIKDEKIQNGKAFSRKTKTSKNVIDMVSQYSKNMYETASLKKSIDSASKLTDK